MPFSWSYSEAFSRNLGLISPSEQEKLRQSRVAVLGLGGVGGVNLVTLARLGIGRFTIADPDTFELANFNRQYGAMVSTILGRYVRQRLLFGNRHPLQRFKRRWLTHYLRQINTRSPA